MNKIVKKSPMKLHVGDFLMKKIFKLQNFRQK